MDKSYDHLAHEDKIYQQWLESGDMQANPDSDKPPFTIVLPPPNVTGDLHLGHAAMLAIEDILVRYKKMTGHEVLWVPGTDHAAIATESVMIKRLGGREQFGRERFLEECRKFAAEKHDNICHQMQKMGAWLDWSREVYTFDEVRNRAVNTMFKMLYDDGLITRGHRLINWSVGAQSVLSDDELEWEERTETLYHIQCGEFVISTVRPETKCSNSPVVVNPDDPKYKDMIGREFEWETYAGKRKFWVIGDDHIDPEFGTGAMTISPCHDAADYEIAQRHEGIPMLQKIDFEGKMTAEAGPCEGMTILECRKRCVEIMREQGLIVKEESYTHRVPLCYRTGGVVEPMVSDQWFVSVEKEFTDRHTGKTTTLKQLTLDAVRAEHVKIIPERFDKVYFHWIENLRDWCISRQIWWGHRIPVYTDAAGDDHAFASEDEAKAALGEGKYTQEADTLDTWFSSALWPMSPLGWPEKTPDFGKFYPTDVLETGHDILFFWVARMIMFNRYATGQYPFHTAYLHGMVTDEHGKKMSKSKGNGINPLEVIEKYGTDPVRLSLVIGTSPGNPIPLGEAKIGGYRNFVNKLWNAARFVQMQGTADGDATPQSLADRWIGSRLTAVTNTVRAHLEKFEISHAGDKMYHFVWGEFCDWYLEAQKAEPNVAFLRWSFGEILKMLHPLCPYITEVLWQEVYGAKGGVINEAYPTLDMEDAKAEATFKKVQAVVTEIRKIRTDKGLNPKEKLKASVVGDLSGVGMLIAHLAGLSECAVDPKAKRPDGATASLVEGMEVFVEIPFDAEAEQGRLGKEVAETEKNIAALGGRLANKSYTEKAPPHLVQQTQSELEAAQTKLQKLQEELAAL